MATFIFQYLRNGISPFKMPLTIIILFTIIVASYTSNGEETLETQKTNEQYLIIGTIIDRQLIRGTNYAPAVGRTNENGTMTRQVSIPQRFQQIVIADYKMYRIEHRLVGGILFSTNVPVSNIVVIVKILADTEPDWKPCIIFADPYTLPDDVIQNNNLQDAMTFQLKGVFKEGPRYDSILQKYGIKPEIILVARVTLKPEALEVSPGILTAFVRLPEGYPVTNIISATCDGAPSERMMPNEAGTEMIVKFRRQDIEAALARIAESLDTNFVVRGAWQGAAGNRLFQGADSITKIVEAKEKKK